MLETGYHATAYGWHDGGFVVTVHRDRDGHEVWGDMPIPAASEVDVPAAAAARLERSGWLPVGEWWEFGGRVGGVWLVAVGRAPEELGPAGRGLASLTPTAQSRPRRPPKVGSEGGSDARSSRFQAATS